MPDPVSNARILNVLKFGADRIGVDAFERREHLAQRHHFVIEEKFRRDLEIEILLAKAKFAEAQQRIFRTLLGEWIDPRDRVPERAIRINKPVHARLERTFANLGRRRRRRCRSVQ